MTEMQTLFPEDELRFERSRFVITAADRERGLLQIKRAREILARKSEQDAQSSDRSKDLLTHYLTTSLRQHSDTRRRR